MERRTVVIIGATGSIGTQTVDVLKKLSGFKLVGFTYHRNEEKALRIKEDFPEAVVISTRDGIEPFMDMMEKLRPDITVAAAPGFAGFLLAYESIPFTKRLALANKESLVCGGKLLKDRLKEHGTELLPVDSEHSAVFQVMEKGIDRIVITASGGALRDWPIEKLREAKPEDVLKHPVWSMGKRITVDSATMANKVLEVLEAMELFSIPMERIGIYVHREGLIHGMVYLRDGTVKIHASIADMRIPIAYALTYPERLYENPYFPEFSKLTFERPSIERYPMLEVLEMVENSYSMRTAFNAADEVAVSAFLEGKIKYTDIPKIVKKVIGKFEELRVNSVEDLKDVDREARRIACEETKSC